MLTGSLASSLQGEPRATHDMDLVVAIRAAPGEVARTSQSAFAQPQFYLDEQAILSAIDSASMFNMIEYEVQYGVLDQSYLDAWAARLGVTALLASLRSAARPIE